MAKEAITAYQLSRIYAEGWNYARTDTKNKGTSANPYTAPSPSGRGGMRDMRKASG